MYENIIILLTSSIISLVIIVYSVISVNKDVEALIKPLSYSTPKLNRMNYIVRKKELEYMKELLQNMIARVYKEYEDGKINEEEKNMLVDKFKGRLLEIDKEFNEVSLYAELESLEAEYKKLVDDFEKRKNELEEKIDKIKKRIKVKEEKAQVEKSEQKISPQPNPSTKPRISKESDLSSLMKELSEMMKRLEEGEE